MKKRLSDEDRKNKPSGACYLGMICTFHVIPTDCIKDSAINKLTFVSLTIINPIFIIKRLLEHLNLDFGFH